MKRAGKIALLSLTVLVLLVGGVAVYALTPAKAKPFEDPVPLEVREANTAGSVALTRFGIENYTVDTSDARILLLYEIPSSVRGNVGAEENLQRLVLAAGAGAAPGSIEVVAAQFVDGEVVRTWTAKTADFRAYEAGEITAEELDAAIAKA